MDLNVAEILFNYVSSNFFESFNSFWSTFLEVLGKKSDVEIKIRKINFYKKDRYISKRRMNVPS